MSLLISGFFISLMMFAQSDVDRNYLRQADEKSSFLHDHHNRIKQTEQKDGFNPLLWGLSIYKTMVSDQLSRGCVYEVTCSDFMRLAIVRYNLAKGFFLGLDRHSRCNIISMKDIPGYKFDENHGLIQDHPDAYKLAAPGN
ncbi:MAG: membrane protein insertion efficiency factor YidD [Bacteroidales bacterium]